MRYSAPQWELGTAKRNRTNGTGFVEKIRASAIIDGWDKPGFNASSWEKATVIGAHPTKPWTGILQTDLSRVHEDGDPVLPRDRGEEVGDVGRVELEKPLAEGRGVLADDLEDVGAEKLSYPHCGRV